MFIGFGGSLATKCTSLNNEQCKTRPALIDLNHFSEISGRICVPNKTKLWKNYNLIHQL